MTKQIIEKKHAAKIALFALLGSLPGSAAVAVVARGDTVLWAKIERAFENLIPEAQAGYTGINHTFPSGWTSAPSGGVVVLDCDCPPPYIYGGGGGGGGGDGGGGGGGGCCTVAGTQIVMSDGSFKNVEDVEVGDEVQNEKGETNLVTNLIRSKINKRGTFILNDNLIEITGDHPILAADGSWKVCDKELFERVAPATRKDLMPEELRVGDVIRHSDGGEIVIEKIDHSFERPEEEIVYELEVNGDHKYVAATICLHNCCGDSGDDSDDGF